VPRQGPRMQTPEGQSFAILPLKSLIRSRSAAPMFCLDARSRSRDADAGGVASVIGLRDRMIRPATSPVCTTMPSRPRDHPQISADEAISVVVIAIAISARAGLTHQRAVFKKDACGGMGNFVLTRSGSPSGLSKDVSGEDLYRKLKPVSSLAKTVKNKLKKRSAHAAFRRLPVSNRSSIATSRELLKASVE